jgi:hypothetical protein
MPLVLISPRGAGLDAGGCAVPRDITNKFRLMTFRLRKITTQLGFESQREDSQLPRECVAPKTTHARPRPSARVPRRLGIEGCTEAVICCVRGGMPARAWASGVPRRSSWLRSDPNISRGQRDCYSSRNHWPRQRCPTKKF